MSGYELDQAQNRVVARLATRARIWGAVSLLFGVLCVAAGLFGVSSQGEDPRTLLYLTAALPQLSVGLSFLGAGRAFGAVVTTSGNDVPLLLDAIRSLSTGLTVQIAMTVLFVLIVAGGIVVSLVVPS